MVRQLHDARSWAFRLRLAAVCGKFGGSERSATAGPAKTARAGSRLPNLWGVGRGHLDGDLQRWTAQRGFRGVGGGLCNRVYDR